MVGYKAKNRSRMILNFIKIRFSQVYRGIRDIGLFRTIILLIVLIPLFIGFLYKRLQIPNYNHIIVGVALFLVFMIHRGRKDYNFLYKLSKHPGLTFYAEYLVFSIPLIILYFVTTQYLHIIVYALLLMAISFTTPVPKTNRAYSKFIQFIPLGLFEWQSGLRKNLVPIILFYIFGFLGIYKIWFSAISVFLLTMLICSFYSECEPRKILEASELSASKFLNAKIFKHVKCLVLFILPVFMLSLIHYEYWIYISVYFLVVINLQVGAILLKYAYYFPNIVSGVHQMIGSIMLLLSLILPFSIIFLFLNILLYYKSVRNLNNYLNAYN